jgi:hypothetical protein
MYSSDIWRMKVNLALRACMAAPCRMNIGQSSRLCSERNFLLRLPFKPYDKPEHSKVCAVECKCIECHNVCSGGQSRTTIIVLSHNFNVKKDRRCNLTHKMYNFDVVRLIADCFAEICAVYYQRIVYIIVPPLFILPEVDTYSYYDIYGLEVTRVH